MARTFANTVVYALIRERDGMLKIGATHDIEARLKRLSRAHGRLRLLATVVGYKELERDIQFKWRQYQELGANGARTDWFTPATELMEWIATEFKSHSALASPALPLSPASAVVAASKIVSPSFEPVETEKVA